MRKAFMVTYRYMHTNSHERIHMKYGTILEFHLDSSFSTRKEDISNSSPGRAAELMKRWLKDFFHASVLFKNANYWTGNLPSVQGPFSGPIQAKDLRILISCSCGASFIIVS